jgi:hypothetical protein
VKKPPTLQLLSAARSVRSALRRALGAIVRAIDVAIYARPDLRVAMIRQLNRFPEAKRRLKAVLSHASPLSGRQRDRLPRDALDINSLSRHAARVFKDLERERSRIATERARESH